MVTVRASIFLSENDTAEKFFHRVIVESDQPDTGIFGILYYGIEPLQIFRIWMNVGIIENARDLVSLFFQDIERVDSARCTAYVKQYLHNPGLG